MEKNILKYISDANSLINLFNNPEASKNFMINYDFVDNFTIACNSIESQSEFDFLCLLLSKYEIVLIMPSTEKENIFTLDLKNKFHSKIYFIDESLIQISIAVDLFILLRFDITIHSMLMLHKNLFHGIPTDIHPSNIEYRQYYFNNKFLLEYFCKNKNINFPAANFNIEDVFKILYGDILQDDILKIFSNSNSKGVDQYMLYFDIAVNNKHFLNRVKEINYSNSQCVSKSHNLGGTLSFVNCI